MYLSHIQSWNFCRSNSADEKLYYLPSPEFTIETIYDESKNGYQFYLFNQTDIHPRWYDINLYYHQTMLTSLEGISLDGGRYFMPSPCINGVSLTQYHHWDVVLKYFIKGTMEFTVNEFYYNPEMGNQRIAHDRFMECILVFDSMTEKDKFKAYVKENWENRNNYNKNIWLPSLEEIQWYNIDVLREEYLNSQTLQNMLKEFRKLN